MRKPQKIALHAGVALLAATALAACDQAAQDQPKQADNAPAVVEKAASVPVSSSPSQQQIDAESKKANDFYERIFEEGVARSPEFLTYLGRKQRMGEWNDISDENAAKELEFTKQNLSELGTIKRELLDPATALSYDLLKQSLENEIEDYQWRLYNYPVNQMFGRHSGVVSLLINQHRISSVADAEAYVSRLNGVSTLFDQLIAGIDARAKANIVPPKFVFPHVIRDSQNIIKGAPFDDGEPSTILADLSGKLDKLAAKDGSDLSAEKKTELLKAANAALISSVKPAYEKLIATLTELETTATTDDGVWKWKNGDDFFNNALKRTTTTDLTADEIHNIGLAEVKRIHTSVYVIHA